MSHPEVTLIDYGIGNLLSVQRGLEHCGANVKVSSDPEMIASAARVVLPGVGAFAVGMEELRQRGLDIAIREVAKRGTPILGICLGMQLLLDESDEFGSTAGLGLIPGRVVPVPPLNANGLPQKIPHIGWSPLVMPPGRVTWQGTILRSVKFGVAAYFLHSYMACLSNASHRLADCLYGDIPITAAISRDNVQGCQFHPEKSGETGLTILRDFILK